MRHRIKDYTITGDTDITIKGNVSIEDVRLIVNETQGEVICSSMKKSNVTCVYVEDLDQTHISFDKSICEMQPNDLLTIAIDKGDSLDDIVGENQNATNSRILEEVQKIPDLKNIYSVRFEKNDDGEDTYSMVLPIVAGVVANEDGETVTIKL